MKNQGWITLQHTCILSRLSLRRTTYLAINALSTLDFKFTSCCFKLTYLRVSVSAVESKPNYRRIEALLSTTFVNYQL